MIWALQELTQALNMDTLKPSFGRVVGIAALNGIYQVQLSLKNIPVGSQILFFIIGW